MEILNKAIDIIWTISSILILPTLMLSIIYFLKEPKIRYPDKGWMDIKSHPIPDNIKDYIATDGKTVSTKYGIEWGPHGEIIFCKYDKTYLKYWQPLPEPPRK